MIVKEANINGCTYRFTLTDPVIGRVNQLKSLYESAYVDPEGFEQISSEIADVVSEISTAVEPKASDADLDGVIQEMIHMVDTHKDEINKQLARKRR